MEEAMENLLFSADEQLGVRKALKRLDEARVLLLHKNGKGGQLAALDEEEEKLRGRIAEGESVRESIRTLESECGALRKKLRADSAALSLCERRIAYTDAAVRLGILKRRKNVEAALQKARDEEKNYREEKGYEGFFPTREYEALLVKKESEYFDREKERAEEAKKLSEARKAMAEKDTRSSAEGEALLEKAGGLRRRSRALGVTGGIFLAVLAAAGGLYAGQAVGSGMPVGGQLRGACSLRRRGERFCFASCFSCFARSHGKSAAECSGNGTVPCGTRKRFAQFWRSCGRGRRRSFARERRQICKARRTARRRKRRSGR